MKPIFSYVFAIASTLITQLSWADQAAPIIGDAAAGKQKITTCAACHGADGNSPIPVNPNLAGQHPEYLIHSITEYQQGTRNNAVMAGMVAGLSPQDIADIAAYYSMQPEKVGEADPNLVKQGELLYRAGDASRGIPACMACHGPVGDGNGPAKFPRVANQHPDYIIVALKEYQAGTRPSSNNMMNDISAMLNDKDMQAVASYMNGLYPAGVKLPEPIPAAGTTPAAAVATGTAPATASATAAPAVANAAATTPATATTTTAVTNTPANTPAAEASAITNTPAAASATAAPAAANATASAPATTASAATNTPAGSATEAPSDANIPVAASASDAATTNTPAATSVAPANSAAKTNTTTTK